MPVITTSNTKIITAGDMSQATLTSSTVVTTYCTLISLQCNILSGSPVGVLKIQVSDDGVFWPDLGASAAVSGTGTAFFDLQMPNYKNFRVIYTKTSGTGSLDVLCSLKGFFN